MYGLDLFSGIGGLTKALEGYVQPVAYCENDRYAQGVLLSRMATGDLPIAPIWDDIVSLKGSDLPKQPDIIYGGFPCQDISVAGRGEGLGGKRSGLFFEIARLVGEIRPKFVFLENVPAINRRGGDSVVGVLADFGYDCRWDVLSASDVGANHRRERWWLLAHATGIRQRRTASGDAARLSGTRSSGADVADTKSDGLRKRQSLGDGRLQQKNGTKKSSVRSSRELSRDQAMADSIIIGRIRGISIPRQAPRRWTYSKAAGRSWWATEPDVGRVAHGVPMRVDRLRGLGNAVVPAQAREAFKRLFGLITPNNDLAGRR